MFLVTSSTLTGERDVVLWLTKMHVSHGTHRVCGLVEVSRVAGQRGSPVKEADVSLDDLSVGVRPIHVELQLIGMYEIDPVVHRLALAGSSESSQHTKCKEA